MTQLAESPAPATPTEFEHDTAIERTATGWRAHVTDRWSIAGNPNGGYLLATAARAMAAAADRPDPLSVTAHFLAAARPGPADIGVDVLRSGRTYTTLTASFEQEGRERMRVVGAFGDLADLDGPTLPDAAEPPALAPPDRCPDLLTLRAPDGGAVPEIFRRFELRIDPRLGWPRGELTGRSEVAGWIRFTDGQVLDANSLLLLADAFPPAILDRIPALWVPTVSLTVMVRATPAPGWLRTVFRTRTVAGGTLEEDGELWDSEDRLVGLSRQLAIVLPAAPATGPST